MSDGIRAAMRKRYDAQGWALLFEVPNATGFAKSRSADAMAVSLWPSRGIDVHGFEFKASRSDWLRELKEPAKADAFAVYCDYWWLVAADKSVAKKEEIPSGWGLLVLNGDAGLREVVKPEKRDPTPWPKTFLAGVMRAATQGSMKASEKELRDLEYRVRRDAIEECRLREQEKLKDLDEELRALRREVEEFEAATGIRVLGRGWNRSHCEKHEVASAVKAMSGRATGECIEFVKRSARSLREMADMLERAESQLPRLETIAGAEKQEAGA